jgi:hypothetical protein
VKFYYDGANVSAKSEAELSAFIASDKMTERRAGKSESGDRERERERERVGGRENDMRETGIFA